MTEGAERRTHHFARFDLTLLATAGDAEEWNDRTASQGHAVVPLESVEVVEQVPKIAQLIRQMGLEIASVLQPSDSLLLEADQRAYGVFHVQHVGGSAFIPSQNFVQAYGSRTGLVLFNVLPAEREKRTFGSLSLSKNRSARPERTADSSTSLRYGRDDKK